MSKAQIGWFVSAVLLVAGLVATCANSSFAQDAPVGPVAPMVTANPTMPPQVVYQTDSRASYMPCYSRSRCCGGPYKGFYPCNGKTPYFGGACNVYGDAPLYTAPADYGHHCAAHCP
jgi:hypothetical protein